MKVKELIELLQALPDSKKEVEVKTEGCDCIGDVYAIDFRWDRLLLRRSEGGVDGNLENEFMYDDADELIRIGIYRYQDLKFVK
jgi:hypothetical protein